MDLFGKKHKAGGRAAKPGTAAASRRNASRKKQDADKVEKLRASNLARKRKPAGCQPKTGAALHIESGTDERMLARVPLKQKPRHRAR